MKKYIYVPFLDDIYYDDDVFYERIEDITDFSINYAVLDAISYEYIMSISFH